MAQRRMFSQQIVGSDVFLDMPPTSQLLYFQLGMYADDEGFVSPKKIMRMVGSVEDDLKILIAKRFLIEFESGVVIVKHWKINNYLQNDRFKPSIYIEERAQISIKDNNVYTENKDSNKLYTKSIHNLTQPNLTQPNLTKPIVSEETSLSSNDENAVFDVFYKSINPTINYGNKGMRTAAADLLKKFGREQTIELARAAVEVQGSKYAPVITNPTQLKNKLAELGVFIKKEQRVTAPRGVRI